MASDAPQLALPPAIKVGSTVTGPVFPHRTYYGKPIMVTGTVTAIAGRAVTIISASGFKTLLLEEARPAS